MNTKTAIANYGLSQLEGFRIDDFDTDASEEAQVIRDLWVGLFEEKIRQYQWQWAERIQALGLVETEPSAEWGFSYRYPSNCLDFKGIDNGDRSGVKIPEIEMEITNDDTGLLILTDESEATGIWTLKDPPIKLWPSDFKTAFAIELAAMAAPRIMKEGGEAKQNKLLKFADMKWKEAKRSNQRENKKGKRTISGIQRARGASTFNRRGQDFPAQS